MVQADNQTGYVLACYDIPDKEHWVITRNESIQIEGDERSRTNPGHGYPASTKKYITYQYFLDKKEFEAELKRIALRNENVSYMRFLHVMPLKLNVEVKVSTAPTT